MTRRLPAGLVCISLAACAPKADLVITGGLVWTGLTSGAPQPGAVAVAQGKVIAVGDSAGLARYVGSKTRLVQANGGLVMPGFADGHTHFISGGFQLASVDLRRAATPGEFIRQLREYAGRLAPGEWILGGDWDHTLWPGQPLPRHEWIDSVTPDNPVFLSRLDGHEALANAAAMQAAGITGNTPTPPGGEILRDARTGEPIGIFKDQALDLIGRAIPQPSPERRDSALARALAHAASLGVTATGHMSASWEDLASYRRLEKAGRMTLRVALYLPLEHWREVADTVRRSGQGGGDDRVRIGGLKGYADGSAGSRTASFFEPYADSAGYSGLMQNTPKDLATWIGSADSAGLQVAVHAIGDRANAIILDIYDSVTRAHGPRDRRFRVEHAQHLRPQDIPRFGRLGVIPSMQPYHAIDDGRWVERRIGPVRIIPHAARHRREAGVRVRLDRRPARPDHGRVRRGDATHARRQESRRLGAGAEGHAGRSAARLYGRERICDVQREEMGCARTGLLCRRRRARPQSLRDAARVAERSAGECYDCGREDRVREAPGEG